MSLPAPADRFVLENADGLLVAQNPHPDPGTPNYGWRPFVWTDKLSAALHFLSVDAAARFKRDNLLGDWRIRPWKASVPDQSPPYAV